RFFQLLTKLKEPLIFGQNYEILQKKIQESSSIIDGRAILSMIELILLLPLADKSEAAFHSLLTLFSSNSFKCTLNLEEIKKNLLEMPEEKRALFLANMALFISSVECGNFL